MKKLAALFIMVLFIVSVACSQAQEKVTEADLFTKASKAQGGGQYKEAVEIYKTIAATYPDSRHRDKALFMIGYIKSENLNEKKEALPFYQELIKKYPESDLIDDAQFMVKAIESGKDALSTFEEKTSNQ